MRRILFRNALVPGCLLACLIAGFPAAAETLLLVVQDGANSRPLPRPSAVREGLTSDLFDAGYIVLDAPSASPFPSAGDLAVIGQTAGADVVIAVATDYSDTLLPLDFVRITAKTTYALVDVATKAVIEQGTRQTSNKDRERDVTRMVLGEEIGRDVAALVKGILERRRGQ
jgi:hypothetical protein